MGLAQPQILNLNKSRKRARYWRDIGEGKWVQTGALPADEFSIAYYLGKGFKAKPPTNTAAEDGLIGCPIPGCEFRAKNAFGLQAHLRKHIKSNKEEQT